MILLIRSMAIVRFSGFNKRHLKCLAWAVLLQAIGEGEGIVHLVVLEDVEAAIQGDFPAMVGHDVAGVDRAGAVELPGEVHAHAACGLLHLLEVVLPLFTFKPIRHRPCGKMVVVKTMT